MDKVRKILGVVILVLFGVVPLMAILLGGGKASGAIKEEYNNFVISVGEHAQEDCSTVKDILETKIEAGDRLDIDVSSQKADLELITTEEGCYLYIATILHSKSGK